MNKKNPFLQEKKLIPSFLILIFRIDNDILHSKKKRKNTSLCTTSG